MRSSLAWEIIRRGVLSLVAHISAVITCGPGFLVEVEFAILGDATPRFTRANRYLLAVVSLRLDACYRVADWCSEEDEHAWPQCRQLSTGPGKPLVPETSVERPAAEPRTPDVPPAGNPVVRSEATLQLSCKTAERDAVPGDAVHIHCHVTNLSLKAVRVTLIEVGVGSDPPVRNRRYRRRSRRAGLRMWI